MSKKKLVLVLFTFILLSGSFYGILEASAIPTGGILRYGLDVEPVSLDPHPGRGTAARNLMALIYNGLFRYDPDGGIVKDLVVDYKIEDPATYVFTIKPDVQFHDGSILTLDDIFFSFNRLADPNVGAYLQATFSNIDSLEKIDELTFRVHLKEPNAVFVSELAQINASIVSKSYTESGADLRNQPMGTGPFRFMEWIPGVSLQVERFEAYHEEGLPYLDGYLFIPIDDPETRILSLMTGDVDMIGYLPWKDMDFFEESDEYTLYSMPGAFMLLMINVSEEPFDNKLIRQAISYAVDRQAVVDIVFFGRGEPITQGITIPGSWAYNSELDGYYTYNPDRARELLKKAGYPDGFSVTLLSSADHEMHYQTAEVVQADLREVGINVTLDLRDWTTLRERQFAGDYQFMVMGTSLLPDPDMNYRRFLYGGTSYYASPVGFQDYVIDEILDLGIGIPDLGIRKRLNYIFERRILDLMPFVFLAFRVQGNASTHYVKGFDLLPSDPLGYGQMLRYTYLDK